MNVLARIKNNPALRCDESGQRFILEEPLSCTVFVQPIAGKSWPGERIVVPSGFSTDFASIPRVFHSVVPKLGRHNRPAILHDWLYTIGWRGKDLADRVFLASMKFCGVPLWRREIMFVAVRYFGWWAWYCHRKQGRCHG